MSEPTVQELNPQNERAAPPEAAEPRNPMRPVGMTVEQALADQERCNREIEARIAKLTAK